jgi:translation initiation factor 3 subunit D
VEIRADWAVVEQIEFQQLQKLSAAPPEPEELYAAGTVEYYNKQYTTLVAKTEKPLERVERQFFKITTTDDPIIRELTMKNRGTIFATDAILATLMAAPRSIYSWDIVVQRVGTKTFLDKRDNTQFDYLTVNETANDPPSDEKDPVNSPSALSQEATFINQNYSQQVLIKGGKKYELGFGGEPKPNPFASTEGSTVPLGSVGYRYRKWQIGEHALVARTEVDAVMEDKGADTFILIKALNEYDTKAVDWRKKVDTQRGAVLATELKNNSNKVAKWTAQAILAGAEQINIGYVSRASSKDSYNHVILGAQNIQVAAFATQISLVQKNMGGILKFFFDTFAKLDNGKYVLVKDPNRGVIRLYSVPPDAFDDLGGEPTSTAQEPQPSGEPAAAAAEATSSDPEN